MVRSALIPCSLTLALVGAALGSSWTQQQELVAPDRVELDLFGSAVSVSGNTAFVGAREANAGRGSAFVFVRSAGAWTQQGNKLAASDAAPTDFFGFSVAVDGDTAIVGAPYKNSLRGAAYVFVRSGGVWSQQQKLTAYDASPYNAFGESVAISGDTVAVGAQYNDSNRGAAYVFVRSGNTWVLQQKLTAPDSAANDRFGGAVALSGNTAVVGAPYKNGYRGAVYVFVRDAGQWSQQQKLTSLEDAPNSFGGVVAVNGDTAVIGILSGGSSPGSAYIFVRSGGVWTRQQRIAGPDGGPAYTFGSAVSIDGDIAVIGGPREGVGGSAWVFARGGGTWTPQQKISDLPGLDTGRTVAASGNTVVVGSSSRAFVFAQATALQFVPVPPCRVLDTRSANGAFGGPSLASNSSRSFPIPRSGCGIPSSAAAYALNVTVAPHGPLGYVTLWPTGGAQPWVSTLNSTDGRIKANAAIVPAGTLGAVSVYATDSTDVVLDINGYFVPANGGVGSSLALYTVSPCRAADTRNAAGASGGPSLAASGARKFPILQSGCGLPVVAQAYSLNLTAVPRQRLGYLTAWPADQTRPYVSTLNAPAGGVVANAAFVPAAGDGGVNVFATDVTDLVIDVNGYFAPPGGSGALAFYAVPPCRVLDTRNAAGAFGGPTLGPGQSRSFAVPASACGIPGTARAYSLNATVVPAGTLGYLTLWPAGGAQPFVSTLNAMDGSITSNAAIVPAGINGAINAFVTDRADLILDINGYFGPLP